MLDSGAMPSGNSLRQTVYTDRASVHQPAKLVAALLRVARVTVGLVESNGFMTHIICRLTANNRGQLRNPALGDQFCPYQLDLFRCMAVYHLLPVSLKLLHMNL